MGLETIALALGASAATASTVGTVGTVASLASAGVGAIGAIQQGNAQSAAAGYNAKIMANNAAIAKQNAGFAGAEGEANVATSEMKTRAQAGATVANQGASGVSINSKSFGDVRASEAEIGKLNAMQLRSNAARQAYGFEVGAASDVAQSQLYRSQQSSDKTSGYLNAGATVLGGAGKAAMFSNFLTQGDPTGGITNVTTPTNANDITGTGGLY